MIFSGILTQPQRAGDGASTHKPAHGGAGQYLAGWCAAIIQLAYRIARHALRARQRHHAAPRAQTVGFFHHHDAKVHRARRWRCNNRCRQSLQSRSWCWRVDCRTGDHLAYLGQRFSDHDRFGRRAPHLLLFRRRVLRRTGGDEHNARDQKPTHRETEPIGSPTQCVPSSRYPIEQLCGRDAGC